MAFYFFYLSPFPLFPFFRFCARAALRYGVFEIDDASVVSCNELSYFALEAPNCSIRLQCSQLLPAIAFVSFVYLANNLPNADVVMLPAIMKKLTNISILLILIVGCKHRDKITVADLFLGDYEKKAIEDNKIDTIYYLKKSQNSNQEVIDTISFSVFDKFGNLIFKQAHKTEGYQVSFRYDTNNLVIYKSHDTDFKAEFNVRNKFVTDSLLLYQFWIGNEEDTSILKFNQEGKIIEAFEHSNDDHYSNVLNYKTKFEYNSSGQLIRKSIKKILRADELEIYLKYRLYCNEEITNLYYTKDKLDSTITKFCILNHPEKNYFSKTYFDRKGLRVKTIEKDTILIQYQYKFKK